MSKRTKKSTVDKSFSSSITQQDPVTPAALIGFHNVPTDSSLVPFPEWNDQEVNAEKWDINKPKIPLESPKRYSFAQTIEAQFLPNAIYGPFMDTQRIVMPNNIDIRNQLRPSDIFPDETIVVYEELSNYPDLLTASQHILHVDLYRDFISAVGILMYLGDCQPWPFEVPSSTFYPVTEDLPWRPYHHIYSIGRTGKGYKHNPQVNTLGKYIVRLFWMGSWRKVLVDDILPVDHSNHVLLPAMPLPEVKQTNDSDIIKNHVEESLPKDFNLTDLWEACSGYTDHYTWEEFDTKLSKSTKSKNGRDKASKSNKSTKSSAKSSKSSSTHGSKAMSVPNFLDIDEGARIAPFHLVATIKDLRALQDDEVMDLSPCWSHSILIHQSRDIPILKPEPRPDLEKWKRFRWIAWAERNGIHVEDIKQEPLKCFKLISVFKKFFGHIIYNEPSTISMEIKTSVEVIEYFAKHTPKNKELPKDKDPKKEKISNKPDSAKNKGKEKSRDKNNKSTKKVSSGSSKSKKKSEVDIVKPPDPSFWSDFYKFAPNINCLYIYMKPSQFVTQYRISDLTSPSIKITAKASKGDKSPKTKSAPHQISPQTGYTSILHSRDLDIVCRNKPLILFMDTIDIKYVVLSLSQIGNRNVNAEKEGQSNNNSHTYVILETFHWSKVENGTYITTLKTVGQKGTALHFDSGRIMVKFWIKSFEPYVLNILSDTPMCIGTLEVIAECMTLESQLLLHWGNILCTQFAKRLQIFGTSQWRKAMLDFYDISATMHKPFTKKENLLNVEAEHNAFKKLILEILPPLLVKDCCFALSVLFREPLQIYDSRTYKALSADSYSNLLKYYLEDLSEEDNFKRINKAAMKLQAFFKRIYVQDLMAMHHEDHPKFSKIYDSLKHIYNAMFSLRNRNDFSSVYFRKLLFELLDPSIAEQYIFYNDMLNVVNVKHIMGSSNVHANSWTLLCRYIFYVTSLDDIKIHIMMFTTLSEFTVRIIDNDTLKDIHKFSSRSQMISFRNNIGGYTVVCYGWSLIAQTVTWKSNLVTRRECKSSNIIIHNADLVRDSLYYIYRPTVSQRVFRCLITVKQTSFVSFRLSTSSDDVILKLICTDPYGKILQTIISRGSIFFPVMKFVVDKSDNKKNLTLTKIKSRESFRFLKIKKGSKPSKMVIFDKEDNKEIKDATYILEAYVIDQSWPLSPEEWTVVDNHKLSTLLHMREYLHVTRTLHFSIFIWNIKYKHPLKLNEFSPHLHLYYRPINPNEESEQINPKNMPSANNVPDVPITTSDKLEIQTQSNTGNTKDQPAVIKIEIPTPIAYEKKQMQQKNSEAHVVPSDLKAPYWCLQTFTDTVDSVTVNLDTRREYEIKAKKEEWYRDDPSRYIRSQDLRKKFLYETMADQSNDYFSLQSFYMTDYNYNDVNEQILPNATNLSAYIGYKPWINLRNLDDFIKGGVVQESEALVFSTCKDSNNQEPINAIENKTFVSPMSYTNRINLRDFDKYIKQPKIENADRKVLTQHDWEEFLRKKEIEINDFDDYLLVFREDMDRFIGDELANNAVMNNWIQGIRDDSDEMMTAAYKLKDDYLASLILKESVKPADGKVDGKKAKGKNKAKGKKK